ncbi:MAG: hypothetical protein A2Z11_02190 [Candidatus Woykebacteria bacterium RBG_16_43_9]|uniref:PIN domain-containing protein n=1 Tax=Candidatus Woykebacteria bacterium RBG_16_43_9 TaxID=1802596 RepID=A0A1G1WGB6_9BACT|nr:MAG: hypothetical protein A2Z11_02190 [Candidatus Woykebacteria bacterium RBG_16_43_9]
MKLVLDASIILKLVRTENEEDQQIALDILKAFQDNKIDILLPNFWVFEIGNALVTRNVENFVTLYDFLLTVEFPTYTFKSGELISIGELAKEYKVSFYDASYHYLARLTSSTLVTADEKYFEKVKDIGNIRLLKDLELPD